MLEALDLLEVLGLRDVLTIGILRIVIPLVVIVIGIGEYDICGLIVSGLY